MSGFRCKNNRTKQIEYVNWWLMINQCQRTNPKCKLGTAYLPAVTVCHIMNEYNNNKGLVDFSREDFSAEDFA